MQKQSKPIRVGVIGVGSMGANHARLYASMAPRVELVGVCDIRRERVHEVARRYNTHPFTDYRRLIKDVDAVSISVPTERHHEIGLDCIQNNIHVLVEKPIAKTVEEGRELVEAAGETKVILQTGHVERFNPAFEQLQDILKKDHLLAIEARRLSPHTTRGNDVSVVFDLMTHDIDLILALVGSPVRTVNSVGRRINGEILNYVTAQLLFENGVIATLQASKVTERKVRELALSCEKSFIEVDLVQKTISIHRRSSSEYFPQNDQMIFRQEESSEKVFVPNIEPLHQELDHFIHCIETGGTPKVSGEDGLETLRVATEIEKTSLRQKLFQLIDI